MARPSEHTGLKRLNGVCDFFACEFSLGSVWPAHQTVHCIYSRLPRSPWNRMLTLACRWPAGGSWCLRPAGPLLAGGAGAARHRGAGGNITPITEELDRALASSLRRGIKGGRPQRSPAVLTSFHSCLMPPSTHSASRNTPNSKLLEQKSLPDSLLIGEPS